MKLIDGRDITEACRAVGARDGDAVMIHSDLSKIGLVHSASSRQEQLEGYFRGFQEAVGPEGTVVALACTETYGRCGKPFIYEESPSEQGVLSEFIRRHERSVRSMHPLFSVCAVGRNASGICGDVSPAAFGHDSPFERLHRANALILCAGVDLKAMTFVHYVEQAFGVPYGYTKEWKAPVFRGGKADRGPFVAFVRYLGCGVEYDFGRLQEVLFAAGLARKVSVGYGHFHAVRCKDVFRVGMECLRKDLFFFLRHAPVKKPWLEGEPRVLPGEKGKNP